MAEVNNTKRSTQQRSTEQKRLRVHKGQQNKRVNIAEVKNNSTDHQNRTLMFKQLDKIITTQQYHVYAGGFLD